VATRRQNERRYPSWEELPDGGRRYERIVLGVAGGYARYVKTVDRDETTLGIVQEIYDRAGEMIAVHHKYPEDMGHRLIASGAPQP
jgi:hypothetical protein